MGIGYLADAGFDPNGMAGFFSTIMRERGSGCDDIPALLLSHPLDQVRIAEARARVGSMPARSRRPDTASYSFIRERVRVLASASDADLRGYYETHARERPAQPGAGLWRGAGRDEIRHRRPPPSTLLKPLVSAQPKLHAAADRPRPGPASGRPEERMPSPPSSAR